MSTDIQKHEPAQKESIEYIKPHVDIFENEDGVLLMANLPGVQKEDLDIEINDETLTFQGHRKAKEESSPTASFWDVHFKRSFHLQQPLDLDNVTAELEHGVLKLHLPKAPEVKTRQIQIQSA